jgi:hypothetical protein
MKKQQGMGVDMAILPANRGTDVSTTFEYTDENGDPVDMTGHTFEVYEASPSMDGHITITEDDLAGGMIGVRIEWSDDINDVSRNKFRIRAVLGDNGIGSPVVEVVYE